MTRDRILKVVLVLVGLFFTAAVWPAIGGVLHPEDSDTGDTMQMAIYATLGVFLLLAVRNPSAHRSLILFSAWSSFAHALVMSLLGVKIASQRTGFLLASLLLVVIGLLLISLRPRSPAAGPSTISPGVHR
jgi:hypothetical protein